MGFSHSIDQSSRKLYIVAQGPITFGEIRTHLHQECADSTLPYAELIDARSARVAPADVKASVELLRRLGGQCPLGPAANQDPAKTYSANASPPRGQLLTEVATRADSEMALEQRRKVFNLQFIALLGIIEAIAFMVLWLKVSF